MKTEAARKVINVWLQNIAIVMAGAWILFEFGYKEILVPLRQSVNLNAIVKLDRAPEYDGKIPVHANFELINIGKRRAYLPVSNFICWGKNVTLTQAQEIDSDKATSILNDRKQGLYVTHTPDDAICCVVALGRPFFDDWLDPGETLKSEILFYVPSDKYDYLEIKVTDPGMTAENGIECIWEYSKVDGLQVKIIDSETGEELTPQAQASGTGKVVAPGRMSDLGVKFFHARGHCVLGRSINEDSK